jgi:hypothetical protein
MLASDGACENRLPQFEAGSLLYQTVLVKAKLVTCALPSAGGLVLQTAILLAPTNKLRVALLLLPHNSDDNISTPAEGVSVICRQIWWNPQQIKLLAANEKKN